MLLSEAPLIEGAVAAAVAARGGSTLEEVADGGAGSAGDEGLAAGGVGAGRGGAGRGWRRGRGL